MKPISIYATLKKSIKSHKPAKASIHQGLALPSPIQCHRHPVTAPLCFGRFARGDDDTKQLCKATPRHENGRLQYSLWEKKPHDRPPKVMG